MINERAGAATGSRIGDIMRRIFKGLIAFTCVILISVTTFAGTDERGLFGGITSGVYLPKTIEQAVGTQRASRQVMDYSEMVFVTGTPLRFAGTLSVNQSGGVSEEEDVGTYNVSYAITPLADNPDEVQIYRNMALRVNYRKVKDAGVNQVILDYTVTSWTERIEFGDDVYTVIPGQSHFSRSVIMDVTPGVSYYKGYSSIMTYYLLNEEVTTVSQSGNVYGYDCPWSKTETERINVTVQNPMWQLEAQVRPSVSVNKLIQYSPNEPTAISFDGNYYEVMKNQSSLAYNIYTIPQQFERGVSLTGSFTIPVASNFEMLPAPDLAFLKGHYAETDISKLFAMQVFGGVPVQFQPAQAMTRAQFVTGLVKALKLPLDTVSATNQRRQTITVLFPDVQSTRTDFPYLLSAYKHGLVYGRYGTANDNNFRPDEAITMEEAITILMRGLGLENLGLANTTITVFADDSKISAWAKREIAAAYKIGIIDMDVNGNINPAKKLTKAEGAAMLNNTVEYMRSGLPVDYREHILNFAD